jgi:type IV pilus assembly protein PilY1
VSPALVRNNAVIFVTLIPINSTCEPSGTGWLMELDLNGARFVGSPIDINDDGKIDSADLVKFSDGTTSAASGVGSTVGIMKTPAVVQTEDCLENKYISGTSSAIMNVKENSSCKQPPNTPNPAASSAGRRSWRQLR